MSVPAEIRSLFSPPFSDAGMGIYVKDAKGHTVADCMFGEFRTRGWGRFKYMKDGERLHDVASAFFATIVDVKDSNVEAARKLNEAWESP